MLDDRAPSLEPSEAGVAETGDGARDGVWPSRAAVPALPRMDSLIFPRRAPAGTRPRRARSREEDENGRELRRSPRLPATARIWLSDGRVQRFTRMVNVSVGGLRVLTASPPPVGTVVSMSFQLTPDLPPIAGQGIVVWRVDGFRGRGGVAGIEFLHVDYPELISLYLYEYEG